MKYLHKTATALGGWLLVAGAAQALTPPTPVTVDGGPLGPLQISAGADGYVFAQSGTGTSSFNGNDTTGARLSNALVTLQKSTGVLQFNLALGGNGAPLPLGTTPYQATVSNLVTGPLYFGYVTVAPPGSPVTASAGELISLEGYEAGVDWLNANLMTTEMFYVEGSMFRGAELNYTSGPLSVTAAIGDGYETGVYNFAQGLATLQLPNGQSLALFYGGNLGRTGLAAKTYGGNGGYGNAASFGTVGTYGANYDNSQLFGAYYTWSKGNLSLTPEVQYQYAKANAALRLTGFSSNLGAALFSSYNFGTSPYSLGAFAEYWTSNGPDAWFIAPGSEGVGLSLTPTWQGKNLFVRADLGYLHLINGSYAYDGKTGAYGNSLHGRDVAQGVLEAGVTF
jgi:hypothetical protein